MEKHYRKMQLEDKALKSAAVHFGKEMLPYLHIDGKIRKLMPTEQIRLEAVRAEEDILFDMEDGTLMYFEFESVEVTEDDLYRFKLYDVYTEKQYHKPVITYVLCSGKTTEIKSELVGGINSYRIIPIQIKEQNADEVFRLLYDKDEEGVCLYKENLFPALLTPLMSGTSSIRERIIDAAKLLQKDNVRMKKQEKHQMEGILYAFACKFLNQDELGEVKEVIGMTALGEMIWQDGLEEGLEEGIEKGSLVKLIELICRKLVKGKDVWQIAEELEEDISTVTEICQGAKLYAPDYDSGKIYEFLKGTRLDKI